MTDQEQSRLHAVRPPARTRKGKAATAAKVKVAISFLSRNRPWPRSRPNGKLADGSRGGTLTRVQARFASRQPGRHVHLV
ncbi:hypothetical protein MRX96_054463 [Rhipicephalus microplus]